MFQRPPSRFPFPFPFGKGRPLVVCALVAGAGLAAAAGLLASPAPSAEAAQAFSWEYRVVTGRRTIQNRDTRALDDGALSEFTQWMKVLNQIGAEGWELVTVLGLPGDGLKEYVFKRPR